MIADCHPSHDFFEYANHSGYAAVCYENEDLKTRCSFQLDLCLSSLPHELIVVKEYPMDYYSVKGASRETFAGTE